LGDRVDPHLRLAQLGQVGHHVELDALGGAGQSDAAHQQDRQQEVREQRREVDHLKYSHEKSVLKFIFFLLRHLTFPVHLTPFQMQK